MEFEVNAAPSPSVEGPLSDVEIDSPSPASTQPQNGLLSPEQLAEVPEIQALLNGEPPAVRTPRAATDPLSALFNANGKTLKDLGLGIYRSLKDENIAFNPEFISPDEIPQLDAEGKLDEVAVPLSSLTGNSELSPAEGMPMPVSSPSSPPLPAKSQNKVTQQRLNALAPTTPTSRNRPGAGTILNDLMERAT